MRECENKVGGMEENKQELEDRLGEKWSGRG